MAAACLTGPARAALVLHRRAVAGAVRCLTHDGYLHKTIIPTFHFQQSLPRLPVPPLEDALAKYLDSAAPVVAAEQLARTKSIVADFQTKQGRDLHTELVQLNKTKFKKSSFISEWWFEMYLRSRAPLAINVNPQMTFLDDPNRQKNDQATRAASMIHASVSFFRTLRDKQLEPDIYHTKPEKSDTLRFKNIVKLLPESVAWYAGFFAGAYALDMTQYGRLFQSTRIPKPGMDELRSYPNSKHIVVQRGADFYTFEVLDKSGAAVPREQIEANIRAILQSPPSGSVPVGSLTTLDRDAWSRARAQLVQEPLNAQSLELVDSAIFAVCLEDEAPTSLHDLSRCMLHGNGQNRWFDKSFQLIVTKNGKCAVNFEHSWGDGVAVLRWFNEVYKESVTHPVLQAGQLPSASTLQRLSWKLDPVKDTIQSAASSFQKFSSSVELKILESKCLDSKFLKANKIGVDGTLQMSFQLAHYRMYGHSASTYESASTAGFKHGRTETIRSATIQSDLFCKMFCQPQGKGVTVADLQTSLKAAVDKHAAITKDALTGKGWDRLLFALQKLAEAHGTTPDIFQDKTYKVLSEIILSTSTLSSPALDGGGFGPVGPNCYGIGYGIRDEGARFSVISFHRRTSEFLQHLQQALFDIRCTIEGSDFRSPEAQKAFRAQEWGQFS